MTHRKLSAALALVLFAPLLAIYAGAFASETPAHRPQVIPDAIHGPIVAGDIEASLDAIRTMQGKTETPNGTWEFLKAQTLARAGRTAEAAEVLAGVAKDYPAGPWQAKARFVRAELLGKLGRHEEAQALFDSAAIFLRSESRRDELAAACFEVLDNLVRKPDDAMGSPVPVVNLSAGLVIIEEILRLDASPQTELRAHMARADIGEHMENWSVVRDALRSWIALAKPKLIEPGGWLTVSAQGADFEPAQEAGLRLANAMMHTGEAHAAIAMLDNMSLSFGPDRKLRARCELQRANAYRTHGLASSSKFENAQRAAQLLTGFLEDFPDQPGRSQAAYDIGDIYRGNGQSTDAVQAWRYLLAMDLPQAPPAQTQSQLELDLQLRQTATMRIGETLEQTGDFQGAIAAYADYTKHFPSGPDWSRAQAQIISVEYQIATAHYVQGDYPEARAAWAQFLAKYPLDPQAPEAAIQQAESFVQEAHTLDSDFARAESKALLAEAVAAFDRVAKKNGRQDVASRSLYRLGSVQESMLGDLTAAIATFQRCNFGSRAYDAQMRLQEILEESLDIRTAKTLRTNETASIDVTSRNLEDIRIELYHLDLEAYFRRHKTHRSIEDLDLDLIQADRSLTYTPAPATRHALTETNVDLPIDGPGTWVVTAVSGKYRATTLVVVSDLDLIIESTGTEALIFAQDMLREAGIEGARIVLNLAPKPGSTEPTVIEAVTDADGLAHVHFPHDSNTLAVLGIHGEHRASEGMNLASVISVHAENHAGYLYTERSTYQPGARVYWRAVVRDSDDQGAYHFVQGKEYDLSVLDNSGRILLTRTMELGPMGTLHGELELSAEAGFGRYSIAIEDPKADAVRYTSTFEVAEFEVPKARLSATPSAAVILIGQKLHLDVVATYSHGAPIPGATVELRADGTDGTRSTRRLRATTDSEGLATFSIPAEVCAGEGVAIFTCTLIGEEGVVTESQVQVAGKAFAAELETKRRTYLANEAFGLNVTTTAANGEPTSETMSIRVLKQRTNERGQRLEVLVEELSVTTNEQGQGRAELSLYEGGDYTLRAEGQDVLGNPVITSMTIAVSDESDTVRLRFLNDTSLYQVGDQATLRLHNRTAAKLALLVVEGKGIAKFQVRRLVPGENELELSLEPHHFPGISISVSLMDDHRFHRITQELEVERGLTVQLKPLQSDLRPGAPLEIEVTTLDGLGHPVAAEFSLALVDEAYYDIFPDASGQISKAFRGTTRKLGQLRGVATCGFAYEGVTRRISGAVLAEEERILRDSEVQERNKDARDFLSGLGYAEESESGRLGTFRGPGDTIAPELKAAQIIGVGGGSGGKFGGRQGGRQNLRTSGGLGMDMTLREDRALTSATKYWLPSANTDSTGKKTLTVPMPDRGGAWRFHSKAVGAQTLAGQSSVTVITSAPFLVELLGPGAVRCGDTFELLARIHQTGPAEGTAYLRLDVDGVLGGGVRTESVPMGSAHTKTVSLGSFTCGDDAGMLRLALAATFDTGDDVHEDEGDDMASDLKLMEVRPFGVDLASTASGTLSVPAIFNLTLPTTEAAKNVTLDIYVSGGLHHELIAAALGHSAFGIQPKANTGYRSETAGELMGTLAVLEWLREANPAAPELGALARRARSLVAALTASQDKEGSWTWNGPTAGPLFHPSARSKRYNSSVPGKLETTAMALLALDRASKSVQVEPHVLRTASISVASQFRSLGTKDRERKAMALHALAAVNAADFADINRLHRDKDQLSQAALAHLVLALDELDRDGMAAELAELLAQSNIPSGTGILWRHNSMPTSNTTWNQDTTTASALSLWALARALPTSDLLESGAQGILAQAPWRAGQPKGLALAAMTSYGAGALKDQGSFQVDVALVDGTNATLEVPAGRLGASVHFALDELKSRQIVPIRITLKDSGRVTSGAFGPTYTARLSGFVNPDSTHQTTGVGIPVQTITAAPPLFQGRELEVGFNILDRYSNTEGTPLSTWGNLVQNLPKGERCKVAISAGRSTRLNPELGAADYLELEVPLAPGVVIVPGTIQGSVAGYRPMPGGIRFTLQPGSGYASILFELMGTAQGSYKLPPMVLRSILSPQRMAYSKPADFTVLEAGAKSPDSYRTTPHELFSLGQAHHRNGDLDLAHPPLATLFDSYDGMLRKNTQASLAEMLLDIAIHAENPKDTVTYFESLKQYDPNLFLSLEQVLAIGRAYRDLGEFERASTMFEATIAETFTRDMRVAGILEDHGSFTPLGKMLDRLWREYPDLPAVVATRLAHADALMTTAEVAHQDAGLRALGRDRASLLVESILVMREFMVLYPDHALAPDAGLNLVSAYLELEDYENVAELAGRLAMRFTEPRIRDDFRYTRAVASWYEDRPADAKDLLLGIANAVYTDDRGAESQSVNRELAYYLLGQIHHAAGDLDKATSFYERVQWEFGEAKELIGELKATRLALPEVTEVAPGGSVTMPLDFKGVDEVELQLYPVDLMTLYLREGDLESVAQVNLAGIAPVVRRTFELKPELGLGMSHVDLELESLETGAYLAMARADGLFASGLVLVTELELLVREQIGLGQVRVQVTRGGDLGFVEAADIRVVGSGDGAFQAGKTDKRGLFVTQGVQGEATVIARLGEREYAFHRGDVQLGNAPDPRRETKDKSTSEIPSFFSNVLGSNRADQKSRGKVLRGNMKKESQGVQVNSIP